MKKIYRLDNLSCASCANTMAEKIEKLDGVKSAKVNFMLSRLTVVSDNDETMPSKQTLQKIVSSVENYCEIL